MEEQIEDLTKDMAKLCGGFDSAVVVGASLNLLQSCMTYGDARFQRAVAEVLLRMANAQLSAISKPAN
ncbi:MAG: hypothetical protein IPO08_23325 [Xanthomonadales bacterium]|nr:hypothetical protein [Xanthomonadales bacterium]